MQIEEVKNVSGEEKSLNEIFKAVEEKTATVEEINDDQKDLEEEEAPDLEEVDLEELEKSKEDQRARFLAKVMNEQEESKKGEEKEAKKPKDKADNKDEIEKLEKILLDEKKCQEVMNKVTAQQINNFVTE